MIKYTLIILLIFLLSSCSIRKELIDCQNENFMLEQKITILEGQKNHLMNLLDECEADKIRLEEKTN